MARIYPPGYIIIARQSGMRGGRSKICPVARPKGADHADRGKGTEFFRGAAGFSARSGAVGGSPGHFHQQRDLPRRAAAVFAVFSGVAQSARIVLRRRGYGRTRHDRNRCAPDRRLHTARRTADHRPLFRRDLALRRGGERAQLVLQPFFDGQRRRLSGVRVTAPRPHSQRPCAEAAAR